MSSKIDSPQIDRIHGGTNDIGHNAIPAVTAAHTSRLQSQSLLPPAIKKQSSDHFDYLDALRGYAITGVFLAHFLHGFSIKTPKLLHVAGSGVTLFYVLSAYCMMLSLSRQAKSISWVDYSIRRFFRIAPAFYTAIALWSIILASNGHPLDKAKMITSVAFINGFIPNHIHSSIPHGWSIAVETSFYFIFPLLFLKLYNFRRSLVALAAAIPICFTLSWALPVLLTRLCPDGRFAALAQYTVFWLPAQLPVFLIGITAYLVANGKCEESKWISKLLNGGPLIPFGLVVLASISAGYLPSRIAHIAVAVCCAGLLLRLSSKPHFWLVNRVMTKIGLISFSAYLFHQMGINLARMVFPSAINAGSGMLAFCLAATLSLLFAFIGYKFIELPGIAIGSCIIRRRKISNSKA